MLHAVTGWPTLAVTRANCLESGIRLWRSPRRWPPVLRGPLIYLFGILLLISTLACGNPASNQARPLPDGSGRASPGPSNIPQLRGMSYTYQRSDGNRVVEGQGVLPQVAPIDVPLSGRPSWVIGAPVAAGILWIAVMENGEVQSFEVADGVATPRDFSPQLLPPGMPPALAILDGQVSFLTAPDNAAPETTVSVTTNPVMLPASGRTAFIESSGAVLIGKGSDWERFSANALPDGRLLVDENERLLFLSHPTRRYRHGVLGDDVEAAGITLLDTKDPQNGVLTVFLSEQDVVEGLAPIWADLDGDGEREIVVTLSNPTEGARIAVFSEEGKEITSGPAVGQGFRWRHQLAVAAFGPEGQLELVDVLTPHIGGVVEFYRLENAELKVLARVPGHTSHILGSRNLDMAAAGDWDSDGRVELLVPTQSRVELSGIRRTPGGAEVVWSLPVGGLINTNIGVVSDSDGGLSVAVGREDRVLRIWPAP